MYGVAGGGKKLYYVQVAVKIQRKLCPIQLIVRKNIQKGALLNAADGFGHNILHI